MQRLDVSKLRICSESTFNENEASMIIAELVFDREECTSVLHLAAVAVAIVAFPVRALSEHVGDIVSLLEAAMGPSHHLGL